MVAFKSGPRPSGKEAREAVEKLKSKSKIGRGKDIIKKDFRKEFNEKFDKPKTPEKQKKEPISPTERMNEKKAEAREQRITLKEIGMAKGGRIGLKAGSKGCKLAMKGKGRAYGKNS
jgi:hypothetical protein